MNRIVKISFAAATVIALGAVAAPATATTRTTQATIGMPAEGFPLSSFLIHFGAVKYTGDGDAWWTMPLVADQTQPFPSGFNPTITGFAPSQAHNLACSNRLIFGNGTMYLGTPLIQVPVLGSFQAWQPGPIPSLPSGGSAEVDCSMGTGSSITNISY